MRVLGARCWAAVCDLFTGVPVEPEPPRAPGGAPPGDAGTDDAEFVNRLSTQLLRHPGRLIAACLVTVLGPAVVAQAGALRVQGSEIRPASGPSATDAVPVPIPGDSASWVPVARQAAATCPGLSSAVLVAIAHLESSLGLQTWTSSAGAVGPMQFLPSTWAAYGVDGDRDGVVDLMNPVDAVHGAARLLCANGGADPARLASALWNYNHSDDYVRQILSLARFLPVES